mgnify:CR=1 FL=1
MDRDINMVQCERIGYTITGFSFFFLLFKEPHFFYFVLLFIGLALGIIGTVKSMKRTKTPQHENN